MYNNTSLTQTTEEALISMRELRERLDRHQQLLENIMAHLQPPSEQFTSGWMPLKDKEVMVEPVQSSQKIRKIGTLQAPSQDIVGKLRLTRLGRFYINHLKRYVVVRWIAHWMWRNGYPFYVNHIAPRISNSNNNKTKRWRPLTKLSEFARKSGTPIYKLADAVVVDMPKPIVFPDSDQSYLISPHERFKFPEIYIATINNALVSGGTNLILSGNEVICHDLYDFERDFTSEELHGRTLIDPKHTRIRWLLRDDAPEPIPAVAAFVDACGSNYAHWMTEVLPRIILFCAEARFRDVPIVVNDGLHTNIMESLLLVAGAEREIITLPIGRSLAAAQLYLTSAAGYVPFERRTNKLPGHSHGVFSPWAFEMLRKHLHALDRKTEREAWPEKIFLRRNSGVRRIANVSELEKLMFSKGYVIVEPEKLTFLQQIQLFNHAKVIVSPTGAALANAVACKPGAQVVVLMGKHQDMIYGYWNNLLGPLGVNVSYVLGNIIENHHLGIHGDFKVNAECINQMIEGFEKK